MRSTQVKSICGPGGLLQLAWLKTRPAASRHNFLVKAAKKRFFRLTEGSAVIGKPFDLRLHQTNGEGLEIAPDQVHDSPQWVKTGWFVIIDEDCLTAGRDVIQQSVDYCLVP